VKKVKSLRLRQLNQSKTKLTFVEIHNVNQIDTKIDTLAALKAIGILRPTLIGTKYVGLTIYAIKQTKITHN